MAVRWRHLATPILLASCAIAHADRIDDVVRAGMAKYKIPGAQVAVVKGSKILKVAAYGTANLEFGVPMRKDSRLQIASATKPITGVAAMMLLEQGKLALDDPVSKYFPEAPASWGPLKVWHLLSFTSGLQEQPGPVDQTLTDEIKLKSIIETPLAHPPGTQWRYSQTGLTLFMLLVDRVAGKPYAQFVQESIFNRVGMGHSTFGGTSAHIRNRNATAYTYQTGPLTNWIWPFETRYGNTGTGLNTTAEDLAHFLEVLLKGDLIKKETMAKMWESVKLEDGKLAEYGLCWDRAKIDGILEVGHEGGGCAWVNVYPEHDLGVVFICNLTGSKADEISRNVARLYFR